MNMSNAITFQPNRMSIKYTAEKRGEDLFHSDDEKEKNVDKNGSQNHQGEAKTDSSNVFYNDTYEEETFCDYLVNVCHCTSWLCANLVSAMARCYEDFVDFIRTCKCRRGCCCDTCGGSEDSLEDSRNSVVNQNAEPGDSCKRESLYCFSQPLQEEAQPEPSDKAKNDAVDLSKDEVNLAPNKNDQPAGSQRTERSSLTP